jgi:hypothetical protein
MTAVFVCGGRPAAACQVSGDRRHRVGGRRSGLPCRSSSCGRPSRRARRSHGRCRSPRCAQLGRASLRVERHECEAYGRLVAAITAEAPLGSRILAIPSDAELYFLADRANPFRFYNTALGVRSSEDLAAVLDALERQPPAVVTYRPADKYNTDASRRIMAAVQSHYERFNTIEGVELYRPLHHATREPE